MGRVSTGRLLSTVCTVLDSKGTTASGEGLSTIKSEWKWDPVHSVATKAEWSLRGEKTHDSWGRGTRNSSASEGEEKGPAGGPPAL